MCFKQFKVIKAKKKFKEMKRGLIDKGNKNNKKGKSWPHNETNSRSSSNFSCGSSFSVHDVVA